MNARVLDVLATIKDRYGDMVFYNHQMTKNLMNDLAPGLQKERIQVGHFLEMNGYFQLKHAGHSYPVVRQRLIQSYTSTYSVHESMATWIVDVFSELLGYSDFQKLGQMLKEEAPPPELEIVPEAPPAVQIPKLEEPEPAKPAPQNPVSLVLPDTPEAVRISADYHSVAVTPEGRVLAAGPNEDGQCNVSSWRNIKAVTAGAFFTVGLRDDGRVVACGRNDHGQCEVRRWRNMVAVSAGPLHTVGLRADGTVVATGQNRNGECNVENWRNIIRISAGYQCTFGVKKDHKALVKGNTKEANLAVSHLRNVRDIANPVPYRALALRRDGRLDQVGTEDTLRRNLGRFRNIRQISAGPDFFAGLRDDGTVHLLAYFWADSGIECNTDDWLDIVAIAAGRFHLLGLKSDGSVIAAMMHPSPTVDKGQCNVGDWRVL